MATKDSLNIFKICLIVIILLYAFFLRSQSFWLPHWRGDQEHYLALAMKLDKFGMQEYNLRGVDVKTYFFDVTRDFEGLIAEAVPAKPGDQGYILRELANHGTFHYDIPLYFIAPAFPYALYLSNRYFGRGMYTVAHDNIGKNVRYFKPRQYYDAQFYAVIVPLFFSLGLILIMVFLGKELFSFRVGLYAAFIMCVNAVDLMASQRIWTDEMATFFVALSILFIACFINRGKNIFILLSGISCGAATMTKQNTAMIVLPILLYMAFRDYARKDLNLISRVRTFLKQSLIFTAPFAIIIFPWFWRVFKTYGTFFYLNPEATALEQTKWSAMVSVRPASFIFYTVGLVCLSPIFVLAYVPLKDFLISTYNRIKNRGQEHEDKFLLLLMWAGVFLVYFICFYAFGNRKEHRYILPAYPALALLSASVLTRIRSYVLKRFGGNQLILSELTVLGILALYAGFGIWFGNGAVLADGALILFPF